MCACMYLIGQHSASPHDIPAKVEAGSHFLLEAFVRLRSNQLS